MKIQSYNHFKLLKSDLPEIDKKVIINDAGVGGIKLVYQVSIHQCITFPFRNELVIIPLPWIYSFKPFSFVRSIEKVFLKPYKEYWTKNGERGKLPKCLWGKSDEPLTELWIEMEFDYEHIDRGIVLPKKEIRDTNITKHLNKIRKSFFVKSKNEQFV